MKVDLENKIALVTGSTRGIGRAIALSFAKNGATIVVNGRDEERGKSVVEEIKALGRESIFVRADVGHQEQVNNLVAQIIEKFGRIDILVNNAGINVGKEGRVPIHEFSEDDWHRTINVDLNGVFYCSKAVAKHMVEQKSGKIINISSIAGIVPLRLQIAFTAAKAGVVNMTRAMALELAPHNVYANCIAPGSTLVEGTRELFYSDPSMAEKLLSHIPLRRPAEPEEMTGAALFLASKDSDYVTGNILVVDGGWTCGFVRDW